MITVEEYRERVLGLSGPLTAQRSPLDQCRGLVVAEPVVALLAVPPFDNSAMDGFAVRSPDVAVAPVRLRVVGDAPAGPARDWAVGPGEAVRVMTGGIVPAGADAIVPVEATDQRPGPAPLPAEVEIRESVPPGRHVRHRGDDVAAGDIVLENGTLLGPAALAAAASVGHGDLLVVPSPRVAIVATGAELVAPGRPPGPGQIPDSNSLMVAALVAEAGGHVVRHQRVGDDPAALSSELSAAAAVADLVITTGGVSVGAFDVVRQVAMEVDFVEVAMQPGKPQGCGVLSASSGRVVPLLAFPGNPVSAFVSFHVFGRPLLGRLAGRSGETSLLPSVAGTAWTSPHGRRQYVPVVLDGDRCFPSHRLGSGSHLIASLHRAAGLAIVADDVDRVAAGDALMVLGV